MNVSDLQAFMQRDWNLIAQAKAEGWIEQKTVMTPSAAFQLGAELLRYARTLRPDWPNESERDADLASHVRVAEMLQRVGQNRSR